MTPVFESNVLDFEQGRENDGDSKLFVVFYNGAILNDEKSAAAGRPIHDDVEMVKIIIPGQRDSVVARATPDYQYRFPRQWAQFKNNKEQIGSGTPLTELTWLTAAQLADLKAVNVHTVEQLAGISDAQAHSFMGFHSLKQRAETYLEAAKGNAPLIQMQAELDKRDEQIRALQSQIDQIMAVQKANNAAKSAAK